MKRKLVVTTSWDDGYPADAKLADLLAKYGVAGTFYVPNRNSEGRPVLTEAEVKQLSQRFELGGHGIDHVVLTTLAGNEATRQIRENKRWLEDVTGKPVPGFCYVQGRYNAAIKDIVRGAGFSYARTTLNLCAGVPTDAFEMPTTVQLFPHRKQVYAKGFAKGGIEIVRARLLWASLTSENLPQRIEKLIALCETTGGYFHLWGHSWELEEFDLWNTLEDVLRHLAARQDSIEFATNYEVHRAATAKAP